MSDHKEHLPLIKKPANPPNNLFEDIVQSSFKWKNLNFKVGSSAILENLSGFSNPKEILAIIGPSGSGKTSLLSALSHNITQSEAEITGEILINNNPINRKNSNRYIRYVPQENITYGYITPFEFLYFTLSLQSSDSDEVRKKHVENMIERLRLDEVKDCIIRDILGNGISGGELKRVCIAAELLNSPSILILDEPTSGLDSFLCKTVIETLRDVADSGVNIILSIHQPGNETVKMIDRVILMQEGKFVYQGRVSETKGYFQGLGFDVPKEVNPFEYYMKLLNIKDRFELTEPEKETSLKLTSHYASIEKEILADQKPNAPLRYSKKLAKSLSLFSVMRLLLWREIINHKRFSLLFKIKMIQMFTSPTILILLFYDLGYDSKGIENRKGMITSLLFIASFSFNYGIALSVSREKTIVIKEINENLYGINSYLLVKLLVSIPVIIVHLSVVVFYTYYLVNLNSESESKPFILAFILILTALQATVNGLLVGTLSVKPVWASMLSASFGISLMVFSGFFSNVDSGSGILRWARYVAPGYYLRNSALKNEFDGLGYNFNVYPKPEDRYGYQGEIYENLLIISIHVSTFYCLAYLAYFLQVNKKMISSS